MNTEQPMADDAVSLVLARAYVAANDNPLIRLAVVACHLRGGDSLGDRDMAYACIALARSLGIEKLDRLLSAHGGARDSRSTGIAMGDNRRLAVFVSYCNDGNIQVALCRRGKPTFFYEVITTKFDEPSLRGYGMLTAQERADGIASALTPSTWWPDSEATLLTAMNGYLADRRTKFH